ncbi:SDR family NAD(P)-dependent oxidoreductase [Alcanivorax sp. 24]|uniref:SDR family NAD(P)-dependent oxidoreductase n=1 Tax=Alcanivorax sp. 24 TaxID=2545266 RepID=UPI00105DD407|nr:SDR family oxidoreductase [Alcanivorax sp. 24]
MGFDFNDTRVVVAGGSRGIGRAIALAFAAAGARVSVCARGAETLGALRQDAAAKGWELHVATCDLGDKTAIDGYIRDAAQALGGLDVLVNCASAFGRGDDESGWGMSVNVDLMGTVRACHASLPYLRESSRAAIINLTSIAQFHPSVRTAPYAAVKAAVSHYTSSLALRLAGDGIRVNAVAPGSVEFPGGVWDDARRDNPTLYQNILAGIPFGRFGAPDDIAEPVLFLASPQARWITGQTLAVDGGQLLS